jgi:hypothetical protein
MPDLCACLTDTPRRRKGSQRSIADGPVKLPRSGAGGRGMQPGPPQRSTAQLEGQGWTPRRALGGRPVGRKEAWVGVAAQHAGVSA